MSLNVANCPRCGRIYAKTVKNLCPDCFKEEEEQYEVVYRYLRENPKSTVQQVSENTGVSEDRILGFLRQDRIMSAEWSHLTYPCERCGSQQINSGRFCESCTQAMQQSLETAARSIKPAADKQQSGYHAGLRRPR